MQNQMSSDFATTRSVYRSDGVFFQRLFKINNISFSIAVRSPTERLCYALFVS